MGGLEERSPRLREHACPRDLLGERVESDGPLLQRLALELDTVPEDALDGRAVHVSREQRRRLVLISPALPRAGEPGVSDGDGGGGASRRSQACAGHVTCWHCQGWPSLSPPSSRSSPPARSPSPGRGGSRRRIASDERGRPRTATGTPRDSTGTTTSYRRRSPGRSTPARTSSSTSAASTTCCARRWPRSTTAGSTSSTPRWGTASRRPRRWRARCSARWHPTRVHAPNKRGSPASASPRTTVSGPTAPEGVPGGA